MVHDPDHAYGIIHRLDVPSSGLILAGITYKGHYELKWQLDTAQIIREYIVLCHGWVCPSLQEVNAPVHHISTTSPAFTTLPQSKSARRSMICDMGKPARTLLRVIAHATRPGGWKYSLVAVRICTGRRHQIRAHFRHIWRPTVTDGKYTRVAIFAADLSWCPTNFLHRHRLQFCDASGVPQEVMEPLPKDLREALTHLMPYGEESASAISEWIIGHHIRPWDQYKVLSATHYCDAVSAGGRYLQLATEPI